MALEEERKDIDMMEKDEESDRFTDSDSDGDGQLLGHSKSLSELLLDWFPLHRLEFRFYMFALSAALMYGAMVPFWFSGSKFLQNHYLLNVREADALMLIPELEMVIFSPILGYCMDKFDFSAKTRLRSLAISCLFLPASYLALLFGYNSQSGSNIDAINSHSDVVVIWPPWIALVTIGLGFVLSHGLIWFSIVLIFPPDNFEFCSGFVCSAINVFPTLIPPLVTLLFSRYSSRSSASSSIEGDSVFSDGADNSVWILWALILSGVGASLAAGASALSRSSSSSLRERNDGSYNISDDPESNAIELKTRNISS